MRRRRERESASSSDREYDKGPLAKRDGLERHPASRLERESQRATRRNVWRLSQNVAAVGIFGPRMKKRRALSRSAFSVHQRVAIVRSRLKGSPKGTLFVTILSFLNDVSRCYGWRWRFRVPFGHSVTVGTLLIRVSYSTSSCRPISFTDRADRFGSVWPETAS